MMSRSIDEHQHPCLDGNQKSVEKIGSTILRRESTTSRLAFESITGKKTYHILQVYQLYWKLNDEHELLYLAGFPEEL